MTGWMVAAVLVCAVLFIATALMFSAAMVLAGRVAQVREDADEQSRRASALEAEVRGRSERIEARERLAKRRFGPFGPVPPGQA